MSLLQQFQISFGHDPIAMVCLWVVVMLPVVFFAVLLLAARRSANDAHDRAAVKRTPEHRQFLRSRRQSSFQAVHGRIPPLTQRAISEWKRDSTASLPVFAPQISVDEMLETSMEDLQHRPMIPTPRQESGYNSSPRHKRRPRDIYIPMPA